MIEQEKENNPINTSVDNYFNNQIITYENSNSLFFKSNNLDQFNFNLGIYFNHMDKVISSKR